MKKLLPYMLAFHAALAAAILLWALQEKFPGPLTNTLSPVWNSPWEMGKAAFFPLLAAAPTLWVLQKGGSRGGLCLMALSGAALALALAWTPLAPACERPRVTPAPSPIAKTLRSFVSSWFVRTTRAL